MRRLCVDEGRVKAFVCSRVGVEDPGPSTAIGVENEAGEIVGGVLYNEYNRQNICMSVAGVSRYWMTRDALKAFFRYPFNQLGVARVTAFVDASNTESIRFVEHLGFALEATMSRAARGGGDMRIYVMFKEDCRYVQEGRKPA